MVKKAPKMAKEAPKKGCSGQGLWFLGFIVFGAFGFASIVQGIIGQIYQGFSYGFFAYLLGLIFIFAAKACKFKMHTGKFHKCC